MTNKLDVPKSLTIPSDLNKRLRLFCVHHNITQQEAIRCAIEEYIKHRSQRRGMTGSD
jgi:predicted DNA-binding protein